MKLEEEWLGVRKELEGREWKGISDTLQYKQGIGNIL